MAARSARALLVMVTVASEDAATAIGRALVEEGLAACANLLGPIRSIYRWQGQVEDQPEHLLLIKTRAGLYRALEARVRELHAYEVPEVIALRLDRGSAPYLAWLYQATAAAPRGRGSRPARR